MKGDGRRSDWGVRWSEEQGREGGMAGWEWISWGGIGVGEVGQFVC